MRNASFTTRRFLLLPLFLMMLGGMQSHILCLGQTPPDDLQSGSVKIPSQEAELKPYLQRLVDQLDHEESYLREEASRQLDQIAKETNRPEMVARLLQAMISRPEVSFEVRFRLRRILKELPEVAIEVTEEIEEGEMARLVQLLEADNYSTRVGAKARLDRLAYAEAYAHELLVALKSKLAQRGLPPDSLNHLQKLYETAKGTWALALLKDPSLEEALLEVTEEQIAGWARRMGGDLHQREVAQRELIDLLIRGGDYIQQVRDGIEKELAENEELSPEARLQMNDLIQQTQPAMVAEYWAIEESSTTGTSRKHRGIQHLLIDVPQLGPGALRPSHFDYCDDERAHCVSGNSLSPGDYPVHRAIPHPKDPTSAIFHLVNLPTPRRRIAYDFYIERTPEPERLAEITEKTCLALAESGDALTSNEISMLSILEPNRTSEFVGKYFEQRSLSAAPAEDRPEFSLRLDFEICEYLIEYGTTAAVPGLLKAIENDYFLELSARMPIHVGWMVTFVLIDRDSPEATDAWLAGLISNQDKWLWHDFAEMGDIGSIAAALLLERHQRLPTEFQLERFQVDDAISNSLDDFNVRFPLYRFTDPKGRQKVVRWWQQQKQLNQGRS
ncbi:Hypothetical protein PBC10988_18590 [Planctomycetales bacterium 10988]|nr:Hypothetical protein PBC10988_18590 [Planctomycetales bacterium 10988]